MPPTFRYAQKTLTAGAGTFIQRVATEMASRAPTPPPRADPPAAHLLEIHLGYAYYRTEHDQGWGIDCRRKVAVAPSGAVEWDGQEEVLLDYGTLEGELGPLADVTPLKLSSDGRRFAYSVDHTATEE
jgi:hypothetical protein